MTSNMKKLLFVLYILNTISKYNGLVEIKDNISEDNPVLMKILNLVDKSTSNANLLNVTLKLLRSLCTCMRKTLNKKESITFDSNSNNLTTEEIRSLGSDKLYEKIYNNTCLELQDKLINKDNREYGGNDTESDTLEDIKSKATLKRVNLNEEVITDKSYTVLKNILLYSLIKTQNFHIYIISQYSISRNALSLSNPEHSIIIILTLRALPNSLYSSVNKDVTKLELYDILYKNSTIIDIDIIDTKRDTSYENKPAKSKPYVARSCHLYSIYSTLIDSMNQNNFKTFRILRREGFIKIYFEAISNQKHADLTKVCCNNNILIPACLSLNDKNKLYKKHNLTRTYQNIISTIKSLVKQYSMKSQWNKHSLSNLSQCDNERESQRTDASNQFTVNNKIDKITYRTLVKLDKYENNTKHPPNPLRKFNENNTVDTDIKSDVFNDKKISSKESSKPKKISYSGNNQTLFNGFVQPLNILNKTIKEIRCSTAVKDWWLDDMYLKVRLPLPINSNPGMVFPRRHFAKIDEVADLAALYIDDLLDYKEMLDRGELPQERATSREKGQPLCMEQFYHLLGVCRIPEVGKDRLELPKPPSENADSEELVVVACRNYFYPIPVKAADRGRLTPGEIQAQLLHVMVDAAGAPPAPRVGLLTSMNRDNWAQAREQLIKDENNRANLDLISRALCVVCLDEAGGDRNDMDSDTNALLRAMHGAGTRYHSANRWFDKTVQLLISSDGTVGMCYEHSPAEGVAVVRLAERALARAEVSDRPTPPPVLLPAPQAMKWNLRPDLIRTIDNAARELDRQISDLDLKVYTYRGYGREYMKSCRTSPDVYIQLAMQYAYYKMYGHLVSTYESASLRRFRGGRVDNIRAAHGAALAWAAAMCAADSPPASAPDDDAQKKVSFNLHGKQKKLELFHEAARKQTAIMEANIVGHGIDNHLLGLREAARENQGELPAMFTDPTYGQMIQFKLSTSQVSTTAEGTFMGYGAVVPDGYGCAYNPKKESVIFCISSFISSSVTSTEAFKQSLEEALDSMKLMFQNRKTET